MRLGLERGLGERFKMAGCTLDPSSHHQDTSPATFAFHEPSSSRRTEQLLAEGWPVAQHGSGSAHRRASRTCNQVMTPVPSPPPPRFDFRPGLPNSLCTRDFRRTNAMQRDARRRLPDGALSTIPEVRAVWKLAPRRPRGFSESRASHRGATGCGVIFAADQRRG